jgi:hypothetical protein
LMRLKGRYMDLLTSFESGACSTLSAGEVGYRNFAMWGDEAMKLVVFWWERERCALIRRRSVERSVGREIFVAYGAGCVSRMTNKCAGGSSTTCQQCFDGDTFLLLGLRC